MRTTLDTAQFLFDSGLLFEINRQVLHPLGLALGVELDEITRRPNGVLSIEQTDDPEGMEFSREQFEEAHLKLDKFMQEGGAEKIATRMAGLGFCIQERQHLHD